VRGYIATGDFGFLNGKPFLHIPYPDPNRLRSLVDGGIEPRQVVARVRDRFLAHASLIAMVGIAVFFFGLVCPAPATLDAETRAKKKSHVAMPANTSEATA
jgi:hypothetical protein